MRFDSLWLAVSLLAAPAVSVPAPQTDAASNLAAAPPPGGEVLALQNIASRNLAEWVKKHGLPNPQCTLQKAAVRKEWYLEPHRICDTCKNSNLTLILGQPSQSQTVKSLSMRSFAWPRSPRKHLRLKALALGAGTMTLCSHISNKVSRFTAR